MAIVPPKGEIKIVYILKCKITKLQVQKGFIRNAVKETLYLSGRKTLTFQQNFIPEWYDMLNSQGSYQLAKSGKNRESQALSDIYRKRLSNLDKASQ